MQIYVRRKEKQFNLFFAFDCNSDVGNWKRRERGTRVNYFRLGSRNFNKSEYVVIRDATVISRFLFRAGSMCTRTKDESLFPI